MQMFSNQSTLLSFFIYKYNNAHFNHVVLLFYRSCRGNFLHLQNCTTHCTIGALYSLLSTSFFHRSFILSIAQWHSLLQYFGSSSDNFGSFWKLSHLIPMLQKMPPRFLTKKMHIFNKLRYDPIITLYDCF